MGSTVLLKALCNTLKNGSNEHEILHETMLLAYTQKLIPIETTSRIINYFYILSVLVQWLLKHLCQFSKNQLYLSFTSTFFFHAALNTMHLAKCALMFLQSHTKDKIQILYSDIIVMTMLCIFYKENIYLLMIVENRKQQESLCANVTVQYYTHSG